MKKVLLVEDEDIIRRGLKKMIEQVIGGYTICGESPDGQDALALIERTQPDVLITDIKLETVSGLELIHNIRLQNKVLPIIIISGHADFLYAKTAINYGVSAYLLKPVNRIELMQALIKTCSPEDDDSEKENDAIIQKIKTIISRQLDKEISLRIISDKVGLNHQYLSALFKRRTGKNFSKYVTEKRIEKAKNLLLESNLKIYEISELSGYHSIKHFTNVFRTMEGCTPSEFKNR
jgi:YesN/AraC family two-component response regulator